MGVENIIFKLFNAVFNKHYNELLFNEILPDLWLEYILDIF